MPHILIMNPTVSVTSQQTITDKQLDGIGDLVQEFLDGGKFVARQYLG